MKLATLCYVRDRGMTLMIHRIKKANDMHAGKWNGLGGKLEPGEMPEDCVKREVFEESGLQVKHMIWKGILTFPEFSNEEDWYAFVYIVDDFDGELIDSPEGNLEWVADDRVMKLNLWEGDQIFLPWLDQPGFFSAKFSYRDGLLVDHEAAFYCEGG